MRKMGTRVKKIPRAILSLWLVLFVFLSSLPIAAVDPYAELKEVIREGFYTFQESIDIESYRLHPDELTEVFSAVIKSDPYLFFVNSRLSYSYRPGEYVLSLKPLYTMTKEETEVAWNYCRREVRRIAAMAAGSPLEKALFLHDYVCVQFDYDDTLQNDNIYSFLKSKRGTCQGYTLLYMALLSEVGIRSDFAASDSISHIWNLVCLEGAWYHADLTWDDSASTEGQISRRHFLCSDKVARLRGHKDWYSSVSRACASGLYDTFDFEAFLHGSFAPGDVDHNGKVELMDLLLADLWLKRQEEGAEIDFFFCNRCSDLGGDRGLETSDPELLRQILLAGELTNVEK